MRIYPIPFRQLEYDKQYSKYDWVEIDLVKNTSDFRPESYKPKSIEAGFKILGHIDTEKDQSWRRRKEIVLKNVHTNMTELIEAAKDGAKYTSLAVFKPQEILDFKIEKTEREWDKKKLEKLKQERSNLFAQEEEDLFEVVKKLPYKFSYILKDCNGRQSKMMIEDWEIGHIS